VPRESVQEKAFRYLREGRLTIERVDQHGGLVVAKCKGETGEWMCGYDVQVKQWRCTCLARGDCAHLRALRSVVAR